MKIIQVDIKEVKTNPKYCQVIIDRMMKLDSNLTVKINGNKYIKHNG